MKKGEIWGQIGKKKWEYKCLFLLSFHTRLITRRKGRGILDFSFIKSKQTLIISMPTQKP
jgi:hypothetical protein